MYTIPSYQSTVRSENNTNDILICQSNVILQWTVPTPAGVCHHCRHSAAVVFGTVAIN